MSSTRGVVDLVVCLDASASMRPCVEAVRKHVHAFLESLTKHSQQRINCRLDFLAYGCDESNQTFRLTSLRREGMDLVASLYTRLEPEAFFTSDVDSFRKGLDAVQVFGDEATLVALDCTLDYPWRPRAGCHRVVVVLTDEPLETNASVEWQMSQMSALIDKIHAVGVMLHLLAPASEGFRVLAEADRSEYQVVQATGGGLEAVNFAKVMAYIGKSVSMAQQGGAERTAPRALFGQDRWVASSLPIRGR